MKINNNKNIFCSVSSGYSSVMMAIMMPTWFPDHNIINVMANTSKEDPESLHLETPQEVKYTQHRNLSNFTSGY